jgi:hypothetical protein
MTCEQEAELYEELMLVYAENDRLRKAMQNAIKEAEQPSYGDPFTAMDYYYDAICILEKALEGK